MTALVTLCLRSHETSRRRPSALLSNVRRCDNARMHASALSLAISMPATTRPLCAIIQLPSLLGTGSKPLQLFGLRKTPDLSHAPRQALWPSSTSGSDPATGGWSEPPVRTFWHIFVTQEHEVSRKTIARGRPGCLGCTCQSRV